MLVLLAAIHPQVLTVCVLLEFITSVYFNGTLLYRYCFHLVTGTVSLCLCCVMPKIQSKNISASSRLVEFRLELILFNLHVYFLTVK